MRSSSSSDGSSSIGNIISTGSNIVLWTTGICRYILYVYTIIHPVRDENPSQRDDEDNCEKKNETMWQRGSKMNKSIADCVCICV
jgi:hypothetical protein